MRKRTTGTNLQKGRRAMRREERPETLWVWDTVGRKRVAVFDDGGQLVNAAAFTPDGRSLFVVNSGPTVTVRDTASWRTEANLAWSVGPCEPWPCRRMGLGPAAC